MNGLHRLPSLVALIAVGAIHVGGLTRAGDELPRLIVLTDIGGDPDDRQSMIRLLTYANEFAIEGLIASAAGTPGELKEDVTKPELIREIVDAYGLVRPMLIQHRPEYPEVEVLRASIKSGNPQRGVAHIGEGHDTEGSNWIIQVVDRPDPRPIGVAIWGGSTDLAQALWRVRNDRSSDDLARFVRTLRVHAISHQDDTGPWILENFPDLFYVLSQRPEGQDRRESAYRGMYLGGDLGLTSRAWVDANVRENHGPLGALYPTRTWTDPNPHGVLKEGDTPSWFFFLPNGLNVPEHPEWGGWGGRFVPAGGGLYRDAIDQVGGEVHARATVWRWRPAFQADFAARMDWCVRPFNEANHPPVAGWRREASRAIVSIDARPGEDVTLDAGGSTDVDADALSYHWYVYPEAGSFVGSVEVNNAREVTARLRVPRNARPGDTIHVILEVQDDGSPRLTGYRRLVVRVES